MKQTDKTTFLHVDTGQDLLAEPREEPNDGYEMSGDLSGVITQSDRVTAQHNDKTTMEHTDNKSTSPSYLVHLDKSHLPDCMCLKSPRTFIPTKTDWFTSVLDLTLRTRVFSCLLCLRTAPLRDSQGVSRILSSRIVTRSIKPSLTFVRHLGAHRKPSSISLPLYSAYIKRNLFGLPEVFTRAIGYFERDS